MKWLSKALLAALGAGDVFHMEGMAEIEAQAPDAEPDSLRKFIMHAYNGGMMSFPWANDPVVVDLEGVESSDSIPALQHHDRTRIVGHTTKVVNDRKALVAEGVISGSGPAAMEVLSTSQSGFPWQASIGAQIIKAERIPKGRSATINSQTFQGPLLAIRKSRILEISWLPMGADHTTSATLAANLSPNTGGNDMGFDKWLEAQGWDVATLSDAQKATLRAAFDAELEAAALGAPAPGNDDGNDDGKTPQELMAEYRSTMAAEAKRIADIQRLGTGHPDLVAQAIDGEWDATKMELEVLRASRHAPSIGGRSSGDVAGVDVLEAAAAQSVGLPDADKLYSDQIMQAAHQRYHGRLSLQELLLEAAWSNGYSGHNFRGDIRGVLEAAFSSRDISGILSNIANKSMLSAFLAVEQAWRSIAIISPLSDFKAHTRYRLIGDDQYERLRPGGEIAHGSLGEDSTTIKADTYAKMFGIERSDMINDDLGILTQVPRKLGRGAGTKLNELFWSIFLDNAAFFSSGNKNYITGSATALSLDALAKADETLRDQVDHEGNPLGISGQILLVPNALRVKALNLMNSIEVRDPSNKAPTGNPFAGQFDVVSSAYLGNATYAGASTKAWYLLTNPADLPTIEVGFLNGQQAPTIESADADFNRLGIQLRGFHDFGVALQEHRAGVKAKGEA